MEVTLIEKNVHNKALVQRIHEHISAIVIILDMSVDIDSLVSLMEMMLAEEVDVLQLEQVNVVGDHRNNKISEIRTGKLVLDVYYKHKNCYNTTHLRFVMER